MGTLTQTMKDSNRGAKAPPNYSTPWQHAVGSTFATEAKTPTSDPMWQPAGSKGASEASTRGECACLACSSGPLRSSPGPAARSPLATVDYFPTIVGVEMPDDRPLDGVSQAPLLEVGMDTRPRPLGFHIRGQAAWHDGDWKAYCAKVNS